MDRYFTYINSLRQLVIVRQDTMFYQKDGKNVANCSVFIKTDGKVTNGKHILTDKEIEPLKEISLDEVYHIVAEHSK